MEITLDNVNFSYDDSPVLHNISLTLNEPGLVCIIGPNGVGKSTLIKCINKILQPDSGQIFLNNKNINDMSFKEISKIMGYVPAAANDMFSMTVIDSILIGRYPHKNWSSPTNEDVDIACDTMEMMSIIHLALRNLNELSAGQHQRASIARGLAQLPQVLILDEPTANLDVRHQLMVTNLLSSLSHKNDMMILMISHDLNIAAKYADKIIIMSTPGIIYKIGTPEEVITPEVMRYVYGVDCMIENVQGHPHVILLDALSDENIRKMHEESE
ncbi:ABC transporter ATP-binding protein [Candidatus Methanomassiliicoccus intestinalis]|uniref:ABC transporter ATP-binding protein n=1 Tax=Candidatus Methanomassiliicoccus intestinalis TaxID=1406512 RepID=UPI0037DD7600